jgi:hypothetical protein
VVGGRRIIPTPQRVIGAADDYGPEELMSGSVKDIEAFLASREDELCGADYRALLEYEQAKKRPRSTLVRGLQALIGEEGRDIRGTPACADTPGADRCN